MGGIVSRLNSPDSLTVPRITAMASMTWFWRNFSTLKYPIYAEYMGFLITAANVTQHSSQGKAQ